MTGYTEADNFCYQKEDGEPWLPVGATVRKKLGLVIYRHRPAIGQERMTYYTPTNPRSAEQQAWRHVFRQAVQAWQALSDEQKGIWRGKAKITYHNGYTLFLADYLDTHEPTAQPWTVAASILGGPDFVTAGDPITIGIWRIGDSSYVKGA